MKRQLFKSMVLILFLTFLSATGANAQSAAVKGMREKATALQKEIAEKEKILLSSQKDVKSKLDNLNIITAQIESRKALMTLLREEVLLIEKEIGQLNEEIAAQECEVEKSKDEYAESLRRARKYSNLKNRLLFIFSADDFNTMVRRYRYANEYMNAHVALADSLSAQIERLEGKRRSLEDTRAAKAASLAEQDAENAKLLALEREQKAIIAELRRESDKVQAEIKKKRSELKKLNNAIEAEIERQLAKEREERKKREAEANATSSSSGGKESKKKKPTPSKVSYSSDAGVAEMSGSFERNRKKMPVPITGPYLLVEKYGMKNAVEGKGNVPINTGGVTFEGSAGAKARCIFDGKVTAVYASDGYSFVLVRHGEYISVYCNLGNIRVKSGDKLKAGDIIGDIVPDAKGGNPRMLFQLRKEKKTLNPADWLKM